MTSMPSTDPSCCCSNNGCNQPPAADQPTHASAPQQPAGRSHRMPAPLSRPAARLASAAASRYLGRASESYESHPRPSGAACAASTPQCAPGDRRSPGALDAGQTLDRRWAPDIGRACLLLPNGLAPSCTSCSTEALARPAGFRLQGEQRSTYEPWCRGAGSPVTLGHRRAARAVAVVRPRDAELHQA